MKTIKFIAFDDDFTPNKIAEADIKYIRTLVESHICLFIWAAVGRSVGNSIMEHIRDNFQPLRKLV